VEVTENKEKNFNAERGGAEKQRNKEETTPATVEETGTQINATERLT
jgi:hypothetical protein